MLLKRNAGAVSGYESDLFILDLNVVNVDPIVQRIELPTSKRALDVTSEARRASAHLDTRSTNK
jgi:hypothetical protein